MAVCYFTIFSFFSKRQLLCTLHINSLCSFLWFLSCHSVQVMRIPANQFFCFKHFAITKIQKSIYGVIGVCHFISSCFKFYLSFLVKLSLLQFLDIILLLLFYNLFFDNFICT